MGKGIAAIVMVLAIVCVLVLFIFLFPLKDSQVYSFRNINAKEAYNYIKSNQGNNLVILDVRTWSEYNASHIKWGENEAINIPYDQLLANLSAYGTVDCPLTDRKTAFLIVYCYAGSRSTNASEILVCNPYANFSNVNNMIDGFQQYYLGTFANPLELNPMANATWDYSDTVVVDSAISSEFKCTSISAGEAYLMMTSGSPTYGFCSVVVDLREPEEYNQKHILNSTDVPFSEALDFPYVIGSEASALVPLARYKNETITLYCGSNCNISFSACQTLARKGFSKAFAIDEGIDAWIAAGYPTVSGKE